MVPQQKLMQAVQRILRPVVRIMLRSGIPSDAATELLRKVYVDVAESEFALEDKPQTTSRISVITGLNRKEVARLRKLEPLDPEDAKWWNRAATVLGAWLRDEMFLDRKGDPLDLPITSEDQNEPTFTQLVKKHSGDMQPHAIADELLRLGALEEVLGRLRMTTRGYVPAEEPERIVDILGLDTAELIETIDHNLQAGGKDTLYQLKVLCDNLPAEYVDEFNALSKRLSQPVLEELNRWLSERDKLRDWSGTDARAAVGLGIYQINRVLRTAADLQDEEQ